MCLCMVCFYMCVWNVLYFSVYARMSGMYVLYVGTVCMCVSSVVFVYVSCVMLVGCVMCERYGMYVCLLCGVCL